MTQIASTQVLLEKWKPVLEMEGMPAIKDTHRKKVIAQILENTSKANKESHTSQLFEADSSAVNVSQDLQGDKQGYNPVLVSLIRRTMPNLVAYDICGVQPMTGPTGLIFSLRPKYINIDGSGNRTFGADAFYTEADSGRSGAPSPVQAGTTPAVLNDTPAGTYTYGVGFDTIDAERLGTSAGGDWAEMGFTIDKVTVTAKERALKAEYTHELAQDLRAIHGIDAENELASILQAEILAEINREVLRSVYAIAKTGAQNGDLTAAGKFDLTLDSNGRWAAERFKGMYFQIEREANQIAKETRRGKGNILICSADVASALQMAGMLDYAPALQNDLVVDDTGNTFAGVLNGKYKVFVDPYAQSLGANDNYFVVGYKGANAIDAGLYYAPYVPLQQYKAIGPDSFQPRMGIKTRYGMVMNPFAKGATAPTPTGALEYNSNVYYRRVQVQNLTAAAAGSV